MNLTVIKNGGLPSLLSDSFSPASVLGRDFFDLDSDLFSARIGINIPTANISETLREYKLELAVPGLSRKDFDIELENHTLTISAEKVEERKNKEDEYSRREYSFDSFCRTFTLPENVKESDIDARYENGILSVNIPKLKETSVNSVHKIDVS